MGVCRKLTYAESIQTARRLLEQHQLNALREFLDDFYGPETYIVDIDVDHEKYGDSVQNVVVSTSEHRYVLPDLTLSAWQDLLAEDEHVFTPNAEERDQLSDVGAYMVQNNVYLDYDIQPAGEKNRRIEAGTHAPVPDLYVLEEDKLS